MLAIAITILAYLCILLAILGFFMPARLGFFLKKPTKGRTVATYLCLLFVLMLVHGGLVAQKQQQQAQPDTQQEPSTAPAVPGTPASPLSNDTQPSAPKQNNTRSNAKDTFCALYAELLSFKDSAEFREKGLQEGSTYASWLHRVRDAEKGFDILAQFSCGVLFGELAKMGEEYARSQGSGTEYTRHMEKEIAKKVNCSKG